MHACVYFVLVTISIIIHPSRLPYNYNNFADIIDVLSTQHTIVQVYFNEFFVLCTIIHNRKCEKPCIVQIIIIFSYTKMKLMHVLEVLYILLPTLWFT